ncbi:MAG: hypothetical protein V1735_01990 [Nanoarchaeota archaeon]
MDNLARKGWTSAELEHYHKLRSLYHAKQQKEQVRLYWFSLILLLAMMLVITILFLPILMLTPTSLFSLMMLLLGLLFGFLFEHLILGMEKLGRRHHAFAAAIIPLCAAVTLALLVIVTNSLRTVFPFLVRQSAWLPALLFTTAFLLPYLMHEFLARHERKHHEKARLPLQ